MRIFILIATAMLCACQAQQNPQFGNANVYTTPGSQGGVSSSQYEVTPF